MKKFEDEYKNLNKAQKDAVDSIDGPVMVVAGPGTGKTQVLTLRIANILTKTDTPASGILCLTFTNAGVRAMRERLLNIVGSRGSEVNIATFHRFLLSIIEKHYSYIDFDQAPKLIADTESVALVDEILEEGDFKLIRPRGDSARYFSDLKSLISLVKKENLSPEDFLNEVDKEIEKLKTNPDNISSRGARKGELKMEVMKELEGLERTKEVVAFYEEYEKLKKDRALIDYDDVLSYGVKLAQLSEDVRATLRENYLYVLVDEHQDSSGIQNAFLEAVWSDVEKPNIFVVGDDRQLIYAFSGASFEHFNKFKNLFGKAKEITLIENYRSTQNILDAADELLKSTMAEGKLVSAKGEKGEKIKMIECAYPRDEIIYIGREIKKLLSQNVEPQDIAILLPKNYQVRSAVETLHEQGIKTSATSAASFFSSPETQTVLNILRLIADPYNNTTLCRLLLDPVIGIPPLSAHSFIRNSGKKIMLEELFKSNSGTLGLDPLSNFANLMKNLIDESQTLGLYGLVQKIGEEIFWKNPKDDESLIRQVEVIRTFIHLISAEFEKNANNTLGEFISYLDRLANYHHEIPLALFKADMGVRILTLHSSKGLEFKHVFIAHLDESSLMKGRRGGFALPEHLARLNEAKDEMAARRELYVAITRAKETLSLSYSRHSYTGADLVPAPILADLPEGLIEFKSLIDTESEMLEENPLQYVARKEGSSKGSIEELVKVVASDYSDTNVSVTLLNNFFECPWKWYFRNILKLPEQKTESLLVGSSVHSAIEYILKNKNDFTEEGILYAQNNCLDKEFISNDILRRRILKEAKKAVDAFKQVYLPNIFDDLKSERSVSYRDPKRAHLSIYGKIDLTETARDGLYHVTDLKTGSSKTKSMIEKRDEDGRLSSLLRQLAMYSYLILNAEKNSIVGASKLIFLEQDPKKGDSVYTTSITAEELDLLEKDIKDYDESVQSGEWVNMECKAKSYGKANAECEYCALAEKIYRIS